MSRLTSPAPVTSARAAALSILLAFTALRAAHAQDTSLVGLWSSKRYFGPEVRGELIVQRTGDRWLASIGARTADVRVARDSVSFDLPSAAKFKGQIARNSASIMGQWIEPQRRIAMPLTLASCGTGCYSGRVQPLDEEFTFYMEVKPRADGKLGAFLRNPERNQGRFIRLDHLVRRGDTVLLRNAGDSTIQTGLLRPGRLSVFLRFATHDFQKVPADSFTHFFPRGWRTGTYTYTPPWARNDGWSVARARDVGMSEDKLAAMVRTLVNSSLDSVNAYRLHGILVARHGKLVLEEYFFGEHADKPHDTRSASKTLVTVVLGAAMQAGMKVGPETPVFATMGETSPELDPRKRAMTVRHLLTMTSGLDCDDGSPNPHPGSENILTNQDTNPDWLRTVVGLKMLRDPGEKGVYCSINPFLAGEVIARATGRSFPDLAWELVGEPLQMGRYYILLTPLGESYMGGGTRFLGRDFLKLAQLYANGGTWNGRRILSEAWIRESIEPRYLLGTQIETPNVVRSQQNYGYLWWSTQYRHQGRVVRGYHASGNGGQYAMFVPDLGLVIAAWGGNYADPGGFVSITQLIPQQILPAIER
jgi:CubicO group peptidase (beta-lactamase class C family)